MTAEDAVEIATQSLARSGTLHGPLRFACFIWRFDLERWVDHFCVYSYRHWKRAVREGPVQDKYVLVEKWRVVFDLPEGVDAQGTLDHVKVDVDDRRACVRQWDGW